jgi:hypothetical protein
MTDWDLFINVCKGNNLTFTIGPENKIFLVDRRMFASKPDYTFFWYDQPKNDHDIPMTNFVTNPLPTVFLPSEYVSKFISHFDPDTGKIVYELYDPSKDSENATQGPSKASRTVAGPGDKAGETLKIGNTTIKPNPTYDQDSLPAAVGKLASVPHFGNNAVEKHRGDSRDAALMANTTATLIAPGHPDVLPPLNVYVRGVGDDFEGTYYLISARHVIGTNGYEMTLDLLRTTTDYAANASRNTKQTGGESDNTKLPKSTGLDS